MSAPDDSDLKSRLRKAAAGFDMHTPEEFPSPETAPERGLLTRRRRSGEFAVGGDCCLMELRRDADGILRWQDGFSGRPDAYIGADTAGGRRRGLRRGVEDETEFVDQLQFHRLQPNQISGWLQTLDSRLTPLRHGLLQLQPAQSANAKENPFEWTDQVKLPASGRILLLVHGTFGSCGSLLNELNTTQSGKDLLTEALKKDSKYAAVCGFEYPTLSVSPMVNAMELARALGPTKADVDVIAHGGGGLVARWWADCLDHGARTRRCIFVGSPLGGTSMTAPGAIRNSMDLFTNVASVLETGATLASSMFPLLSVVSGMLKVVGSVTEAAAKLPIADAVLAAIPGLAGQSFTSTNFELQSLRRSKGLAKTTRHAIRSDFQPVSEGWKFWRYFTSLDHAKHLAADRLIFQQANDLVVDSAHMTSLAGTDVATAVHLPKTRVLDLGPNPETWHGTYFRNPEVLKRIRRVFDVA